MTDRVGLVLGGRYRLVAPIGTGASASVYLADDVTLRRRVAVKILHDALADDAAFLRRFRAEAQAAAALNHPHIMAVYDWGHGDVPFLVTEYLGGGSLRAMLDLGTRLTPAQALLVGLEASRGLEYAHRRGFVHRDIKPANLLYDEDARLRIADFGLARALAEAAWTEPLGAVLGTARYASPEQARGATLDGRSDVYSLGLVLAEAVTGEVPFAVDTTIGTLMARVDQPVPVSDDVGPLRPALEAAGQSDPAARPDAAAFSQLLLAAAKELERPEPFRLAGAMTLDLDVIDDRDPTAVYLPERVVAAGVEPEIMHAPPGTTTDGLTILSEGEGQPETIRIERDEPAPDGRGGRDGTDDGVRTGRRWPRVLAIITVLALLVGGFGVWYTKLRVVTHEVPSLVGGTIDDAEAAASSSGWKIARTDERVDGTVAGQVLAQDPVAGTSLKEGAEVALTVSLGPTLVDVPVDLGGLSLTDSAARLAEVGLVVGPVTREFSESVARDAVLTLAPGVPPQLPKGDGVALVVSDGPTPRIIPGDLAGKTQEDATAELKALGLAVALDGDFSETVPAGTVLSVRPDPGEQVPRDSTVTLVLSKGPPTVTVPSVANLSASDAATKLQAAGLTVTSTQGSPANKVTGTNPPVGTVVRKGSSIVIITG